VTGQIAIAVALVLIGLLLAVAALAVRRTVITRRGGVVECALRRGPESSWRHGLAEYERGRLSWHWWLSYRLRPSASFDRAELRVVRTRPLTPAEATRVGAGLVVAECRIAGASSSAAAGRSRPQAFELALSDAALTGLLSWLESSPQYYLRAC
jgi:hypothetical protein